VLCPQDQLHDLIVNVAREYLRYPLSQSLRFGVVAENDGRQGSESEGERHE
jgi:hypothetical protein